MSWDLLTDSYGKRGIVLALGAGVSVSSKLPSWDELLRRLASESSGRRLDCDQLIKHRLTPPVIASVFEEYAGDRKKFVESVRQALYRDFPFFPEGVGKHNRRQFVRQVREENTTLHAVATLCARGTDTDRYMPNPRVRGIVTFNLDALIQAYVYARFEKRLVRTVERASASSIGSRVNIYHMHGFLRFDPKAGDPSKECPDVVLTETDYFDFFNDPTSLFNYTFLYLLREETCLFVGLSMQDENIRRMLHLSKKERWQALKSQGASDKEARQRCLRHFAILNRSSVPEVDKAIEDSLLPLGTRVLWIDDFRQIAEQFSALYESAGDRWSDVS